MSRSNSRAPLLDRTKTISPSPAREALKGNLDTAADATMTLRKKKSWFGSLRDAVQKGALQAKAAVDALRSDRLESDQHETNVVNENDTEPHPRQSTDTATSSSGLSDERRHPLTSKHVASLRHHLVHHSSKRHLKRSSVYTVDSRASSEVSDKATPEKSAATQQHDSALASHKRHTSLVDTLVGSMRRRTGFGQPPCPQREVSTKTPAESIPLPSSPINIPVAAPALELDLGPAAFTSHTFELSPGKKRNREDLKLLDAAHITTGVPKSCYLAGPEGLFPKTLSAGRAFSSGDVLNQPTTPFEEREDALPSTPATLMPGTNLSLEVDGANSDGFDKPKYFERTVMPSQEKERTQLRAMCSLDAMADACVVAHSYDEKHEELERKNAIQGPTIDSPKVAGSPELPFYTPHCSTRSVSTLVSCPSDMEELSRQRAAEPVITDDDQEEHRLQHKMIVDIYAPAKPASSGPPSPVRAVALPFRPKPSTARMASIALVEAKHAESRSVEILETSTASGSFTHALPTPSLKGQLQLQHEPPVAGNQVYIAQSSTTALSTEHDSFSQTSGSEDQSETDSDELIASCVNLPSRDGIDHLMSEGLSPHSGPLVPQLFRHITSTQGASPGSASSRTTYMAGLGDGEHRFAFDSWLLSTTRTPVPDEEPRTPQRRSMDMSLDSVSMNDDRQTPQISPRSSTADRTPSIGDRLEFDLKRSERNMRYNALNQDDVYEDLRVSSSTNQSLPAFTVRHYEHEDVESCQDADVHAQPRCFHSGKSPRKDSFLQGSVGSEKSVETTLRYGTESCNNGTQCLIDQHSDAASSTSHDHGQPPSKLEGEESKPNDEAGGALDGTKFSPTMPMTSRGKNSSPNRFAGLEVSDFSSPYTDQRRLENVSSASESSADPLPKRMKAGRKGRITSTDTLDDTLRLFCSPESGYNADKSSVSPPSKAKGPPASRFHSLSKRGRVVSPLERGSTNIF